MATNSLNIVVPYVDLHPVTKLVLSEYDARFVPLTDEYRYVDLMRDLWRARQTVVLVEHDIVPWHGALDELYHCMGRWCACSYKLFGGYGVYHGLGCTKLSADLMARLPGVWDDDTPWDRLDQQLLFAARAVGEEPHGHRPPVIHLHERDWVRA